MVDSKQKGARAELAARDKLRELTGLKWERIPASGALGAQHGMKGDLYVPQAMNVYAVEVKHYKDDQLTSKVLSGNNPQVIKWWIQAVRQANQTNKSPLLLFKYNRSKWFIATCDEINECAHMYINKNNHSFYVALLEDWIKYEEPIFII